MSDNQKSTSKGNSSDDQGKLGEMNDSKAKDKKSSTGIAKEEGTLGEMNDEADRN